MDVGGRCRVGGRPLDPAISIQELPRVPVQSGDGVCRGHSWVEYFDRFQWADFIGPRRVLCLRGVHRCGDDGQDGRAVLDHPSCGGIVLLCIWIFGGLSGAAIGRALPGPGNFCTGSGGAAAFEIQENRGFDRWRARHCAEQTRSPVFIQPVRSTFEPGPVALLLHPGCRSLDVPDCLQPVARARGPRTDRGA